MKKCGKFRSVSLEHFIQHKPVISEEFLDMLIFLLIFKFSFYRQPTALQLLTSLYVGRSYHIWKDASILPWYVVLISHKKYLFTFLLSAVCLLLYRLERNVNTVLDMVDAMAPIIKECSERRQTRFDSCLFTFLIVKKFQDKKLVK